MTIYFLFNISAKALNRIRTDDLILTKNALYLLSYEGGLASPTSRSGLWTVKDSNLRRRQPADLQSAPVVHLGNCPIFP